MPGFYLPVSGFIAHGFRRRERRRRSMVPVLINWTLYEPAPNNGLVMIDSKTAQLQNSVDMIQSVKWDNPIGAAVWLQSDSGDLVKLPPYSSGAAPILVGQGDSVTMQLDPAVGTPPPAWSTLITFLGVPSERSTDTTASPSVMFNSGAYGNISGTFDPGLGGYVASYSFHNIGLTNVAATLFALPIQGRPTTGTVALMGAASIIGYDLALLPAGFAAATNVEIQLAVANMQNPAVPLFVEITAAAGAAPQQYASAHGKSYTAMYTTSASAPAVTATLSASIGAATLTASGSVDMLIQP